MQSASQLANAEAKGGADSEEIDIAQVVTDRISLLMDEKFAGLQTTLENLAGLIQEHSTRVEETENRISAAEDEVSTLKTNMISLQRSVKVMEERIDDLENRSRRDNIRIVGLGEGIEGRQPLQFFESWLRKVLGFQAKGGRVKIDRAHRAGGIQTDNRPRPVVIKLHNFSDEQKILQAAREKGQLRHDDRAFSIKPDYSPKVKAARREFNKVCDPLIQKGIRFTMHFPANLCVKHNGQDHSFKTH